MSAGQEVWKTNTLCSEQMREVGANKPETYINWKSNFLRCKNADTDETTKMSGKFWNSKSLPGIILV